MQRQCAAFGIQIALHVAILQQEETYIELADGTLLLITASF